MRRAIRITLLLGLSLLTGGLAFLWARSYRVAETYHVFDPAIGREYNWVSARGGVSFYREAWDPNAMELQPASTEDRFWNTRPRAARPPRRSEFSRRRPPYSLARRAEALRREHGMEAIGPWLGLAWFRQPRPEMGGVFIELMLPYWLLTLGLAGPTAGLLRRHLRGRRAEKRRAAGRCAACGYDLRASSGRCPECGAAPPAAVARPA